MSSKDRHSLLNNLQLAGLPRMKPKSSYFLQMNPAAYNEPFNPEPVMADILDTIREHYAEDNPRLLLTPIVLIQHGAAPNIVFVATLSGWSQPAIVAAASVLPMSITMPSTAVISPSSSTGAPSVTAPPRRTRPRQSPQTTHDARGRSVSTQESAFTATTCSMIRIPT
jgi:hypothetical protein